MFVAEAARRRGIARSVLAAIEAAAIQEGMTVMRLETGVLSDAAIALYAAAGYVERDAFAPYKPDPLSVFMEKELV